MVRKMKFAMPALALAFALAFTGCSNDIGYDDNWGTWGGTATGASPATVAGNILGGTQGGTFTWFGVSEHQVNTLVQAILSAETGEPARNTFFRQSGTDTVDVTIFTAAQTGDEAVTHTFNLIQGSMPAGATGAAANFIEWEIQYTAAGGMYDNGQSGAAFQGTIVRPGTVILRLLGTPDPDEEDEDEDEEL